MTLDDFQRRALFVPFVIGGRDWSGWDCWGLIFVAFRDVFARPIASYGSEYDAHLNYGEIAELIAREKSEWNKVSDPATGDVGLYRVGRYASHVGLVVPGGRVLHCEGGAGTISEPLDGLIWGGRNVGYFRRD